MKHVCTRQAQAEKQTLSMEFAEWLKLRRMTNLNHHHQSIYQAYVQSLALHHPHNTRSCRSFGAVDCIGTILYATRRRTEQIESKISEAKCLQSNRSQKTCGHVHGCIAFGCISNTRGLQDVVLQTKLSVLATSIG